MRDNIYETDLFDPIKNYFENLAYTVKAEVKDCDIVAVKDDEIIIIEMKKNLNLTLLSQAVDRQKISDQVYVAVLRPAKRSKAWKKYLTVLKKLELGLIYVDIKTNIAEIVFYPKEYIVKKNKKRRITLVEEFEKRSKNYNQGGINNSKIMTAYKENSFFIVVLMYQLGAMSAKELKEYGTGDKTYSIIYQNHYRWFEKVGKGLYGLSEIGLKALDEYIELKDYYMEKIRAEKEI